jgi:hypothetical protein
MSAVRRPALYVVLLAGLLSGCTGNETPSGPRIVIPPTLHFTPGQTLSYQRRNLDQYDNTVSTYNHEVEVLNAGRMFAGMADVATVMVSTSGGNVSRTDTVELVIDGGKLKIYDARMQSQGRVPALPVWNTLLDLNLRAVPDTILAFDSTFAFTMASSHLLRDRVTCDVETRYLGEQVISAFGSPTVNSFVFTRTVLCTETVDTAGQLLFQGPVVSLLDSLWFGDGIGPLKWTSRGSTLGLDSLGLPFSLAGLQVLEGPSSHDSYEVHYLRTAAGDVLTLREGLYYLPPTVSAVTVAYAKNF